MPASLARSGPEYQSELLLLSRTILLQGSASMGRHRAGGHVRVEGQVRCRTDLVSSGCFPTALGHTACAVDAPANTQARIRGVMAYRMGQLGVMGR